VNLHEMGVVEFGEIQSLINDARRETLMLIVALQRRDDDEQVVFAAARANLMLDAAARLLAQSDPHQPGRTEVAAFLRAARIWAQRRLYENRARTRSEVYTLLASAAGAYSRRAFDGSGATFRDIDLGQLDLQEAQLRASTWDRCAITASLFMGACFDESLLMQCDASRSSLERATFRRARVQRCQLAGAAMIDTILDDVTFTECDLRGADFSAPKLGDGATAVRARFVRCDLRETNWRGRSLHGVKLEACKLHGAFGRPRVEGTELDESDLSVDGDGSRLATPAEVIREWRE
jgi:uncharacterized protein YjbI with pentapeptide repeats